MEYPYTGDNQIECGECGGVFFIELNQCPHCGQSVYFPDEKEETQDSWSDSILKTIPTPVHTMLLVLFAGIISGIVALVIYLPIRPALGNSPQSFVIQSFIYVSTALGALVGGYVGGRFARVRRLFHGLMVGVLSLLISLLMLSQEFYQLSEALFSLLTPVGWGLVIGASYAGAQFAARMVREQMADFLFAGVRTEASSYQDLLSRVGYDESVAERLLEYERKSLPNADRIELIHLAIARWERDNRIPNSGDGI